MQKELGNILLFLPEKYGMELHVLAYLPTCLMSACMLSCWWACWFCWNIFSLKPLIVINFTVKSFPSSSHKMGQPFSVYKGQEWVLWGPIRDLSPITLQSNTCSLILVHDKDQNPAHRCLWFKAPRLQLLQMNDDTVQYETFACVDENMVCSPSHFFKLSGKICEE